MGNILKPTKTRNKDGSFSMVPSEAFKALRRLHRLKFTVTHRKDNKVYSVHRFTWDDKYGTDGGNARQVTFDQRMEDGTTKKISIYDYYQQRYGLKLQHWYFPLIMTSTGSMFPFEVCQVPRLTPYPFKLDPQQVGLPPPLPLMNL